MTVTVGEIPTREYWEAKHPAVVKFYAGRPAPDGKPMLQDVRQFLSVKDQRITDIATSFIHGKATQDDIAHASEKWVRHNVGYVADSKTTTMPEYWFFPSETLFMARGDCEDGSLLMAALMLTAGVDPWRVRVTAGEVRTPNSPTGFGGHAWVSYCRLDDNEWVPLDWCYWPQNTYPAIRRLQKDDGNYVCGDKVWFSFTRDQAYDHSNGTTVGGRVRARKVGMPI